MQCIVMENTLIKLTLHDETKKRAHDSQIVRAKENLKLSHGKKILYDISTDDITIRLFVICALKRLKALSHYNALANVCRRMKNISSTLAYAEIELKNQGKPLSEFMQSVC